MLGAGVMGAGIAQVMAIAGHQVACHDVASDVLVKAREHVETGRFGVRGAVERKLRPSGPYGMTRGASSGWT